jgi:hypothetical protein
MTAHENQSHRVSISGGAQYNVFIQSVVNREWADDYTSMVVSYGDCDTPRTISILIGWVQDQAEPLGLLQNLHATFATHLCALAQEFIEHKSAMRSLSKEARPPPLRAEMNGALARTMPKRCRCSPMRLILEMSNESRVAIHPALFYHSSDPGR